MRLKKPWSGWFNYPKHPKTTNFTMLHPSPKTLPRREPPVEPSVDATADLTEMEHFGHLWHRGRSGWLQLIWWCSMVFIFLTKKESTSQVYQQNLEVDGTNQDRSEIRNDEGDFSWFDGVQWCSFFSKNQRSTCQSRSVRNSMCGFASKPTTMCRAFSTWAPRIGGPRIG